MAEETAALYHDAAAARILELLEVVKSQLDEIREHAERNLSGNGATSPMPARTPISVAQPQDVMGDMREMRVALDEHSEIVSRSKRRSIAASLIAALGIAVASVGIVTAAIARSTVIDIAEQRNEAATIVLDRDGADGINTVTPTAWRGDKAPARIRVSRADGPAPEHLVFVPYQYGMAIEYPTNIEVWAQNFSVHSVDGHHGSAAHFWVGDEYDTGGLHVTAHADGNQEDDAKHTTLISETFPKGSHGGFQFVTRNPDADHFQFMSGPAGQEVEVARITGTGKVLAEGGLGVGNTEKASHLGAVVRRMEVFDAEGHSLGFVPIYKSIS